jgi:hypothetical protein
MSDIIKTWPASMHPRRVLEVFTHDWGSFYFTLGRGKPQKELERLWFTHRGRILGSFQVDQLIQNNETNIPKLASISGEESEWQIKPDRYVVICDHKFVRLKEKLYYQPFRGWHYFSLESWRGNEESKINV